MTQVTDRHIFYKNSFQEISDSLNPSRIEKKIRLERFSQTKVKIPHGKTFHNMTRYSGEKSILFFIYLRQHV